MIYLIIFVSLSNGFKLAYNFDFICLIIQLICIAYSFYMYKLKGLRYNLVFIISLIIGLIIKNIKYENISSLFVVTKSESNYIVVSNFIKSFYVKIKNNNHEIGDIVYISGNAIDLKFSSYEQGFDFVRYLNSYNCFQQIEKYKIIDKYNTFLKINAFKDSILTSYSSASKQMIASLIFKDSVDSSLYKNISLAGISYLITTSGLHISFLIEIIKNKLKDKIDEIKLYLIVIAIIFIFYILSSFSISLLRILLMNLLYLLSKKFKINADYISRISLTGIIILIFNPFYEISIGFNYSFTCLIIFELIKKSFIKGDRFINQKSSLIFCLVCLPLNLKMNHGINLLAFFLTILFSKFFSVLFLIDLLVFIPKITVPFLEIINVNIYKFIETLCKVKLFLICGDFNDVFVFIYYILLILIALLSEMNFKKQYKVCSSLFVIELLICFIPNPFYKYEVIFINVGQGDSTLIRYKDKNILIDTGGSNYVDLATNCLIPYFNKLKIYKLDAVLITHEDNDHIGALESLKANFKIEKIVIGGLENSLYFTDLKIDDLNKYKDKTNSDNNYNSSVFQFKIRNTKFLITGDAPIEIENKIIISNVDLKSDVIKLGHHGSNTSSSYDFLQKVDPKLAIISCGYKNMYNHPSKEVIDRLTKLNIKYVRTDLNGSIIYKC